MSKRERIWAMRQIFGILAVLVLALASLIWGLAHNPPYVGITVASLIALAAVIYPAISKEKKRIGKEIDTAYQEAYAQLIQPPSITISTNYGYPTFKIQFRSKAARDAAAAKNEMFKEAIDRIYKGFGSRSRPFSAQQAIFFTYEGHEAELLASDKAQQLKRMP